MSCWTKPELENMLEDVVNELTLSGEMIEKHGQLGTAPAELVRLVLEEKDRQIFMLKRGIRQIELKSEKEQLPIHSVVNSNCDKKPKKCKHKYGLFTQINNGRNLMFKCKKCKRDMTYKQLQIERKERK